MLTLQNVLTSYGGGFFYMDIALVQVPTDLRIQYQENRMLNYSNEKKMEGDDALPLYTNDNSNLYF